MFLRNLSDTAKGIILSLGAILLAVIVNVMIKANVQFIPTITLSFLHAYVGLILNIIIFYKKINWGIFVTKLRPLIPAIIGAGFIGTGIGNYTRILSLDNASLLNVSIIESTMPLIVYFLSIIILKQKFDWRMLLFILFASYGVIIISTNSAVPTFDNFSLGEFFALITITCVAIGAIYRRTAMKILNPFELTFLTRLASLIVTGLIFIKYEDVSTIYSIEASNWILLLATALLGTILLIMANFGIKYIGPTLYSEISLTRNIYALVLGFLFFAEIPNYYGIAGSFLIILSVYLGNKVLQPKKISSSR